MYCLQVRQGVVIGIDAGAEEQSCVSAVDNLRGSTKLDEVGLVLLVARCYKAVYLALELDLVVVCIWAVPFG